MGIMHTLYYSANNKALLSIKMTHLPDGLRPDEVCHGNNLPVKLL